MSEVSDATQIVLLTARGGYLLGRISIAMAIRTLKLLNTLYHAKITPSGKEKHPSTVSGRPKGKTCFLSMSLPRRNPCLS